MIIVTGSVLGRAEGIEELVEASLAHVRSSRTEPGCLAHGVYRDAEDPLRLFFYEEWSDRAALAAHFAVPGSLEFVGAVTALAAAPPEMRIYDAQGPTPE